jgi:hypothetical protein
MRRKGDHSFRPACERLEDLTLLSNVFQINIDKYVNRDLRNYTNGSDYPPGGTSLTVGGVPFTLANYPGGGTGVIQTPSQSNPSSFDVPVTIANPSTVYTLINSTFGVLGDTVGSVEFKATGGLDYSVNLVEGQDIRDHNNNVYNNTIGQGALGDVYVASAQFGGGQVRLDEQRFALPPSFQSATLTDIILHGTGKFPIGNPFLAAATVIPAQTAQTPTITWSNPADIVYGTALGAAQLDATASVPGTFTYSPPAGTVLHAGAGQLLSVIFEPTDTTDYTTATVRVSINVRQAAPTITWANPADIVQGTALGAAQLDAMASVPGTFTYSPSAGTVLAAGNHQMLSVRFAPTDTTDYTNAAATVSINVLVTSPPSPQVHGTETVVTAKPRSATFGQPVTLTAMVENTSHIGGRPTGQVGFWDGPTLLSTVPLIRGKAKLTTSGLHFGLDPIEVIYSGDQDFAGSSSNILDVIVRGAPTRTTATSSRRSSSPGQAVTFTATVRLAGKGQAIPTGSVWFWDGSAPMGLAPLIAGKASLTTSTLSAGTHRIRVVYEGDPGFNPSSASLRQMVKQSKPSIAKVLAGLLEYRRWS